MERKLADIITASSGSMLFVYLHIIWFAAWFFFKFSMELLTLIVSLEAIFLSTFIMISQNREQEATEQRLAAEEIQEARSEEEIDDIQNELDDLQQDIDEVRRLITRIEQRTSRVTDKQPHRLHSTA